MSGPSIRRRWFVAAAATAVVTPIVAIGIAHAATVTNLFVSPSGSDSNVGTSASAPLKTLAHARDGKRAVRATGKLPIALKQTSTGYTTATTNPMDNWRNPTSIEFVYRGGLGLWTEPRCPVASISPTVVKMAQPCWNNSTQRVMRT